MVEKEVGGGGGKPIGTALRMPLGGTIPTLECDTVPAVHTVSFTVFGM